MTKPGVLRVGDRVRVYGTGAADSEPSDGTVIERGNLEPYPGWIYVESDNGSLLHVHPKQVRRLRKRKAEREWREWREWTLEYSRKDGWWVSSSPVAEHDGETVHVREVKPK